MGHLESRAIWLNRLTRQWVKTVSNLMRVRRLERSSRVWRKHYFFAFYFQGRATWGSPPWSDPLDLSRCLAFKNNFVQYVPRYQISASYINSFLYTKLGRGWSLHCACASTMARKDCNMTNTWPGHQPVIRSNYALLDLKLLHYKQKSEQTDRHGTLHTKLFYGKMHFYWGDLSSTQINPVDRNCPELIMNSSQLPDTL